MNNNSFELPVVQNVLHELSRDIQLMQVIIGPRQTGKTTAAQQISSRWEGPVISGSADESFPPDTAWIRHTWGLARRHARNKPLLVLDEIQKVPQWSEIVKALWDEDRRKEMQVSVILLGSSSLLIQKGLTESMAGRFLLHRIGHWGYDHMREAFDISLEKWLYFGGYPGAAALLDDEQVWRRYIRDSLIETVLAKDVLQMHSIAKPALLRNLFLLSASYPSQILSYTKMKGRLTDAGNTTTLAHYVTLLSSAFLLSGLELYKIGQNPKRGSSPKLVLWNNACITALNAYSYEESLQDRELWGRIVENAVGAVLLNQMQGIGWEVFYWRKGNDEVDFILKTPRKTWAIEVKSSRMKNPRGLGSFLNIYPKAVPFFVGGSGMSLEEFFTNPMEEIFR